MASEDGTLIDTPDPGHGAGGPASEPKAADTGGDSDPLAAFGERSRPSRRFYANPADS